MALTAVSIGVLVLAAAAFVLSYPGLHAVARQAGISAPLARGYPVILDAMLVIACAAVLSLRGAGAVTKFYAWLSLLVLLGATAGADALHSTGTVVPHKDAAFAAAVLPWVLVLIGFGLLLAMMRHFRLHRPARRPPRPARRPGRRSAARPPCLRPRPPLAQPSWPRPRLFPRPSPGRPFRRRSGPPRREARYPRAAARPRASRGQRRRPGPGRSRPSRLAADPPAAGRPGSAGGRRERDS